MTVETEPTAEDDQPESSTRSYTPLFQALNQGRYERQGLIREYEDANDCRLAVVADSIFQYSVTYFEDLLHDAEPDKDLHLLLWSPGGDGETAIRMVRAAQSRCRELVVIVPEAAKSAATILALGAHQIMMGPTSDLGPIDPQFQLRAGEPFVAAKDIIAAVERATEAVQKAPDTYPIYATLLADVDSILLQRAVSALARTNQQLREALASNVARTPEEVEALAQALDKRLVEGAQAHGALFGMDDADQAGLPVMKMEPTSNQWEQVWQLYTRYFALGQRVYESRRASQVLDGHPFGVG